MNSRLGGYISTKYRQLNESHDECSSYAFSKTVDDRIPFHYFTSFHISKSG